MNTVTPVAATVIKRHSLITRLTHWINALAMAVLLMSGLQIFNAHPSLYWGQSGFAPGTAWLHIGTDARDPSQGTLRVGHTSFRTTGFLGVATAAGWTEAKAFPGWLTIPSQRDLSTARRWHFFFAWALAINGMLYLSAAILSGHLQRDLWPRRAELAPRHLAAELWNHLRLRFPKGEAARHYNVLQKLSYVAVVLGLGPLIVLTGLTMSPGFNAVAPFLLDMFGGRQSARSIHFIAANLLLAFFVVHILALLAVGVWNELRSMFTGRYVLARKE